MNKYDLPKQLPIFPLTGATLLPKGHLPLNIFEPRYREMVETARETNNVIGMVQPAGSHISSDTSNNDIFGTAERGRELYLTGCAGLITEFSEIENNQYFIVLTGIRRFKITRKLPMQHAFREVEVSYDDFTNDSDEDLGKNSALKKKFDQTLSAYLDLLKLDLDHESFSDIGDEEFINSLAMICPFDAPEKQLLVEAPTLQERTSLMIKIMDFNRSQHDVSSESNIH